MKISSRQLIAMVLLVTLLFAASANAASANAASANAASANAMPSTEAKRPYLVVRGMNDKIYYNVWTPSGGWAGWIDTPGATPDSPGAVLMETTLDIVVRGMDNRIWFGYVSLITGVFSGWTQLSGATPSAPALTFGYNTPSLGGLIFVVRGLDNRVYYRLEYVGDWVALPGATIDGPAAVAAGLHKELLHIVVRGMDGNTLWHGQVNLADGNFYGWTLISGATPSRPALDAMYGRISTSPDLVLVVRGLDNRIYYRHWTGYAGWLDWNVLDGATNEGPAAALTPTASVEDDFHIVVKGLDGHIYHRYRNLTSGLWTPWTMLSGATPSAPELSEFF